MITYSKIYESVAYWLDREDMHSSIPQFVRLAELQIYRYLRIPVNETSLTLTAADDPYIPIDLPNDYKEMRLLVVNGKALERISDQRYYELLDGYQGPDIPQYFTEINNQLYILPWATNPNGASTTTTTGAYASPTAVDPTPEQEEQWGDATVTLHYWTANAPELMSIGEDAYIYGGVYQAWSALAGPTAGGPASVKAAEFEGMFGKALVSLEKEYKRRKYAGSTKQVTSAY